MLIEEDEDAPPTRYMKACPKRIFKHELEALMNKTKLTSLDWSTIKRFYILKAHCSSLEPDKKPIADAVPHERGHWYQTLNHPFFTLQTPFNMIYPWTREFSVHSNHTSSFVVHQPHSIFIFNHQVQPIIEKLDFDVEAAIDPNASYGCRSI